MYKCDCETKYDLTEDHYKALGIECEKSGISTTVVICPGCHKARIVGSEADWDETEGKPCHLMFGFSIDQYDKDIIWKEGLKAFVGKKEE